MTEKINGLVGELELNAMQYNWLPVSKNGVYLGRKGAPGKEVTMLRERVNELEFVLRVRRFKED